MARKRVVKKDNRRKTAKIKPLSQTHIKRTMINNGMSLGLLNSSRTFTTGDVPAMMEDDQVALGLEYLKIPIAQAPIAVKVSHPEAHAWATDLYQRVWNALIPKIDLALAYGENAYEPMYRKDKKNPQWWDFADDFDVAPPMSSIPWTTNEKIAFVAVHDSFGIGNMGYYWFETGEVPEGCSILEGAGVYRPSKVIWIANDCLTSRWYGRSVLRAAHLRWKGKNMPDGCLENLLKASFKSAFSGTLLRYPAGDSVVNADGSIVTSEEFADFILQVMKTGSGIRLPAKMKDGIGWDVEEYAKNLVDPEKVQAPLDYLDRGILRGMGIPDEVLTHDGSTGGYSRSLVSIDAFYSRGETRAQTILPSITEMIVNPLGRQRYGPQFEATAHIMRQQRPDGGEQNQDADGNGIPDALEGAMQGNDQGQEQDSQQNGNIQDDSKQMKGGGEQNARGNFQFAVTHAPAGGVTVKGKEYKGGQFTPSESGDGNADYDESDMPPDDNGIWSEHLKKTVDPNDYGLVDAALSMHYDDIRKYGSDTASKLHSGEESDIPIRQMVKAKVHALMQKGLKSGGISKEHHEKHVEVMNSVLDTMNPVMAVMAAEHITKITSHPNPRIMSDRVFGQGGKVCSGAWNDTTGELHIDGAYVAPNRPSPSLVSEDGNERWSAFQQASEIYAHELGHAIDKGFKYSNSSSWIDAMKADGVTDGELSGYATTSNQEGWAEYIRYAVLSPALAEIRFPKCWDYLASNGMVKKSTRKGA